MTERPCAPAALRNREPILAVLTEELRDRSRVLEIGSGTGQHAVYFAEHLPHLTWQTSDIGDNHAAIRAWIDHAGLANALQPLVLDVESDADPAGEYDAAFAANTAHIMSPAAVRSMFALLGRLLPEDGCFCLYGPFRLEGEFTSESNAEFDASLRSRGGDMGIRDIEWLDELALEAGLRRSGLIAMPANNFIAVWRKIATLWA